MLEVTIGRTKNRLVTDQLIEKLNSLSLDGSLYIGFPIIATADVSISVDALLVSEQHGLVVFLFADRDHYDSADAAAWQGLADRQDQLFVAVENDLRQHEVLRTRRRLAVTVQAVTLVPMGTRVPQSTDGYYAELSELPKVLREFPPLDLEYLKPLQAALQKVVTIKPPKRRSSVASPGSKGAILRKIEGEIANLDQWQKQAAMECPDGLQRIRGLAGSGKTVVLALKAAYLHAYYPDWSIGVTFFSRSLYQQFEDLIRRFSFAYSNDEPDWERLQILHCWGGRDRPGVYSQIAAHCGVTPRDFVYARERFGQGREFEGICSELWSLVEAVPPEPIYDIMLIDEAQDCPAPFFKLVRQLTRPPKRIVWAYDELQNLSEYAVPNVEDLFGVDEQGSSSASLVNAPNSPSQDIILQVCYRNTPWSLSLAHGLGLGTAREQGLIQSFDDPNLWTEIGYQIVEGQPVEGSKITVERAPASFPEYVKDLITSEDAVSSHLFHDVYEQARWIANNVRQNLEVDELEPDDILIVLPSPIGSRQQAQIIIDALWEQKINGHLVGVGNSRDEVFTHDSVAIAHIHRSKGNEAPMVYVANAQFCVDGPGLITRRNTLFTAITRSKAWVRICGWGSGMAALQQEIEFIKHQEFRLQFNIPTDTELVNMRRIHRDLSPSEIARVNQAHDGIRNFVDALEHGDVSIRDIPLDLRVALQRYMAGENNDDP